MAQRTYELVIVYKASSDKLAEEAANAAFDAIGSGRREALVRERLADGSLRAPSWDGWDDEEATLSARLTYDAPE